MPNEEENTLDTIRDLIRKDPFVPFGIVMTSGDRCTIDNPEGLAVGGSQLHYYRHRSDKAVHLRLNQIAAVEESEERNPAA